MSERIDIELGHGKHLVTDIYDQKGQWAGIAVCESQHKVEIGKFVDAGVETVGDLEPILIITTEKPESLDVIIQACERAKDKFHAPSEFL